MFLITSFTVVLLLNENEWHWVCVIVTNIYLFFFSFVKLRDLTYTVACRCMAAFKEDYKSLVPKLLIETTTAVGVSFLPHINLATVDAVPETKALSKRLCWLLYGYNLEVIYFLLVLNPWPDDREFCSLYIYIYVCAITPCFVFFKWLLV